LKLSKTAQADHRETSIIRRLARTLATHSSDWSATGMELPEVKAPDPLPKLHPAPSPLEEKRELR
jgi:hypothetical protein